MTIFQRFAPRVAEFIAFLDEFAQGSYLQEGEKQSWSQPFDPSALPELQTLLEQFLLAVEGADPQHAWDAGKRCIEAANAFNRRHHYELIDTEEEEEIRNLVIEVLGQCGVDASDMKNLPDFD